MNTSPSKPLKPAVLEWADHEHEPHDGIVKGPTPDDVRSIVEHLARNAEPGGFVILKRADSHFIQCALQEGGLIVEHHEPAGDSHFALATGPCDAEFAVALFRAWLDDPAAIAEHAEWEEMEL